MIILMIIILNLLAQLNCHSSHSKSTLSQLDIDASKLFSRYTNNTNSDLMSRMQLNEFMNQFRDIILATRSSACFNLKFNQLVNETNQLSNDTSITLARFSRLSYYLVSLVDECFSKRTLAYNSTHHDHDHDHNTHSNWTKFTQHIFKISKEKWLYAFLSVLLISVGGLLCVLIVPVLNTYCFDYLFQFLVALALGTLCGDALLHLIPHAFVEHEETNDENNPIFLDLAHSSSQSNQTVVLKGLGAFLGIYIFFLIEKTVKFRQNYKEKEKNHQNETVQTNGNVNPSFSVSPKKSSRQKSNLKETNQCGKETKTVAPDCVELTLLEHKQLANQAETSKETKPHSHAHSHSQNSDGMKSNALMVILGDGLHNFSDGLAIGASFAVSITAGFGTTIAVFCHELPHEIGDFAVLKKSGVSTKRAAMYNILSSVLCFIGVLVGLLIGGIEVLSDWSFLFIAGTFLYISLVDIIPELNESKSISSLVLQNLGVLTGLSIMLVIGLFENEIHDLLK